MGESEAEVLWRIAIARECMNWHWTEMSGAQASPQTPSFVYNILPVLHYGAETWTLTKALVARVDAFDQWCQRHILRVHYSDHVTNAEVCNRTG